MLAANIVVGTGRRLDRHKHVVGADRIAHIGHCPQRLQIANLDHRGDEVALDHGDLLGEGGFGEDITTARSGVSEHSCRHYRHAVGLGIEPTH